MSLFGKIEIRGPSFAPRIRPPADVYRTERGWLVKIELAGVGKEDVQVLGEGHSLLVRGRRRDSFVSQCSQCVSLEITYSEFERRIDLPCELSRARIGIDSRDGMLLIQIEPETME